MASESLTDCDVNTEAGDGIAYPSVSKEALQDVGCVKTKGISPNLNSEYLNESDTNISEANLNNQQSETTKMELMQHLENANELRLETNYKTCTADSNEEASEWCSGGQTEHVNKATNNVEHTNTLTNLDSGNHVSSEVQEMLNLCRPKEGCGNPIASSFSTGTNQTSKIETENVDPQFRNEGLGKCASIPGRAIRTDTDIAPDKTRDRSIECMHQTEDEAGVGSYSEHKGNRVHDKDNPKMDEQEQIFRGIDAKWRTNDDDLYDEAHDKYEYFWKKNSVFSQWYQSYFTYEDQQFNCAEQYMMYQKAILFGDCRIANKILKTRVPPKIKSLGRKVQGFTDEVWNAHCLHIVKKANICKFSQNRKLKEKLESTYPKLLVEASPIDFIWGIGCAEDDPDAWDEATWRGKNYLGYILTEVRDELLCDSKFIKEDEKKVYIPYLMEKMDREKTRPHVGDPDEGTEV